MFDGIRTFTCINPAENGASPGNELSAGEPWISTLTLPTGFGNVFASPVTSRPLVPGGFVWPSPVANSAIINPGAAGFADEFTAPF